LIGEGLTLRDMGKLDLAKEKWKGVARTYSQTNPNALEKLMNEPE
jgi:hypothetical protein